MKMKQSFGGMLLLGLSSVASAAAPDVEWISRFATTQDERGFLATINATGEPVLVGRVRGGVAGNLGGNWIGSATRFSAAGVALETVQLGTTPFQPRDEGHNFTGGASGYAFAVREGTTTQVQQFNAAGTQLTNTAFQARPSGDFPESVVRDASGNLFVTGLGYTLDSGGVVEDNAYISKLNSSGAVQWTSTRKFGYARDIALDSSGNIYVAGSTFQGIGGTQQFGNDAFLLKYSPDGTFQWARQVGTNSNDVATALAIAPDGGVVVVGQSRGALVPSKTGSNDDAFVVKFNPAGQQQWISQFGSVDNEFVSDVVLDPLGGIYLTGERTEMFSRGVENDLFGFGFGFDDRETTDVMIWALESTGGLLWSKQLTSEQADFAESINIDAMGSLYVAGYTLGNLAGTKVGNATTYDSFLVKLDAVAIPEPTTITSLLIASCTLALRRRRRNRLA